MAAACPRSLRRAVRQCLLFGTTHVDGEEYKGADLKHLAHWSIIFEVHHQLGASSQGHRFGLGLPQLDVRAAPPFVFVPPTVPPTGHAPSTTSGAAKRKREREAAGLQGPGSSSKAARAKLDNMK